MVPPRKRSCPDVPTVAARPVSRSPKTENREREQIACPVKKFLISCRPTLLIAKVSLLTFLGMTCKTPFISGFFVRQRWKDGHLSQIFPVFFPVTRESRNLGFIASIPITVDVSQTGAPGTRIDWRKATGQDNRPA
jgi:hypothetical protein